MTIILNFYCNSFEGIEGTVDIATICGTTGPILGGGGVSTESPTASPTLTDEPTENRNRRDLFQEDEQDEEDEPTENKNNGRDLSQEDEQDEDEEEEDLDDNGNRRLQDGFALSLGNQQVLTDVGDIKLGLIVQTISIHANMPLPVAP